MRILCFCFVASIMLDFGIVAALVVDRTLKRKAPNVRYSNDCLLMMLSLVYPEQICVCVCSSFEYEFGHADNSLTPLSLLMN